MANIITNQKIQKHKIDKYNFKVLAIGADSKDETPSSVPVTKIQEPVEEEESRPQVDSSAMSTSSKDSLIESLLKKTDEMSSNFIKLQMKLENMTEEHKAELEKIKEESFTQGLEEGKQKALVGEEKKMQEVVSQYSASVLTLETRASEFECPLEGIKKELISAA